MINPCPPCEKRKRGYCIDPLECTDYQRYWAHREKAGKLIPGVINPFFYRRNECIKTEIPTPE